MATPGERELDPVPFLVLGLAVLAFGLVMVWRGVRRRRRDPGDWLRIFVEGLLLTGVGSVFAVHAAIRLLG
ncbi:hypothetical protein [Catellatospora vulcania]|uniref:hypothetical protein n=1 Tax=Catellatospora vulcania TaxID=1460450 RepID=UPI0012D499E9|nr:hypothetical protein [Catellatospora vulcania]